MKFLITIKQQTQSINTKPKCPLYKPPNQKNINHDKGLQTLDQLLNNSSLKIFCHDCKKQITLQTIVVSFFQHQQPTHKQQDNAEAVITKTDTENPTNKQKPSFKQQTSKIKISTRSNQLIKNQSEQEDQLFQQSISDEQQNQSQLSSSSQIQQNIQNQDLNIQLPKKSQQDKPSIQQSKNDTNSGQFSQLYCVGCFASLQEFPSFYSIRKSLKFTPENSDWPVYDQICLLNGLKFWGFGNWSQIKQFMDYNSCLHSLNQIQSHYESLYIFCQGPKFLKPQQFDLSKTKKPAKVYLQDLMHKYYYPDQDQQVVQNNSYLENIFKRQRPVSNIEQQKNYRQNKKNSQKQKLSASTHSQKRPRRLNSSLSDSKYPSNSALSHILEEKNEKQNNKKQQKHKRRNDEQSESQDESQQQKEEDKYQQIQLKPRSSSKLLPDSKMHHYQGGKGLKQSLSRSGNLGIQTNISQMKGQHPCTSNLKGQNVYSYNPKRKQFEIIQYDYYAQSMLAQLQFSQQDTEEQKLLKIKIIEEYNNRLDQRIKRRQFVIQHRLLDTQYIIKNINKYNKYKIQKFQPFRRLIQTNQEYNSIIELYHLMNRNKSLTNGIIKINKKISLNKKNVGSKDIIDYLNKKKQKKQALGHKPKIDTQNIRKVYYKHVKYNNANNNPNMNNHNKKLILSMNQNSSSYVNYSYNSQNSYNSTASPINSRSMANRSQERQRLKNLNRQNNSSQLSLNRQTNSNRQTNQNQNTNNQKNNGNSNNSNNSNNNQITNLLNVILTQQDIHTIQRISKQQLSSNYTINNQFKPINLKNYLVKPLLNYDPYKFS